MKRDTTKALDRAFASVRAAAANTGNADDFAYYELHESRFRRAASRLIELLSPGADILDIGSHYLHLASALKILGFNVTAMDIPAHATLPFVKRRATRLGIPINVVHEDGFVTGKFLGDRTDGFDCVLFCEILEHITFNPIDFWRRVHELLRPNGIIYLTTPNSLKLLSLLGAVWNLVSMRRIGLNVRQIMASATFGHHWKEYSAGEIREYFERLSPDFQVRVGKVHYGNPTLHVQRILGPARTALIRIGNATGFFADNLEAVISLRAKTPWRTRPPVGG